MKIYTKTGDKGQTSLSSGERISKGHLRVQAYGTVDEVNSYLGLLRNKIQHQPKLKTEIDSFLFHLQNQLFNLGTHLSSRDHTKIKPIDLDQNILLKLEGEMDRMTNQLPKLTNFILPGGSELSCYAHILRTVCRRAERLTVELAEIESLDPFTIMLLNRLSDYFFVLARYCSFIEGQPEVIWTSK